MNKNTNNGLAAKIDILSKTQSMDGPLLLIEYNAGQEDDRANKTQPSAFFSLPKDNRIKINKALTSSGLSEEMRINLIAELFEFWLSAYRQKKIKEAEEIFGEAYSRYGRNNIIFSYVRSNGLSVLYQNRVWYGIPFSVREREVDSMGGGLLFQIAAKEERQPSMELIQRLVGIASKYHRQGYTEIKTPYDGTILWLG